MLSTFAHNRHCRTNPHGPNSTRPILQTTLTYRENTTDKDRLKKDFDAMRMHLGKAGNFHYVIVAERRKRGVWHLHVAVKVTELSGPPVQGSTGMHLRWLDQHLSGVALADIDRDRIDALPLAKRREPRVVRTNRGIVPTGETISAGPVRRVIGVLKAVLNAAVEWEWLDRAPVTKRTKIVTKRIRWLTQAEAERLLAELPEHLADMARFSLETGLRRSNVTGLQWSQFDMVRRVAWIHPDQAKAKKAITVPLSDTAIAVLRRQLAKKRVPEFVDSVFVYHGKPVYQTVTAAWRKAQKRAGIRDFRWHDLRHTWANWHVQRYAHLSADHLAHWVTPLTTVPAPKLAAI